MNHWNINDNIKQLAKQADCTIDGMGYGEGNLEQFAKLIIEECANVAWHHSDLTHQIDGCRREHVARKIEQHFGIKR